MKTTAALAGRSAVGGFTLIELLLTLVLVLLLLGAVVINFTSLQEGVQLDEGAEQLETVIRYARAHAANTGCKVQLSFEELVEDGFAVPLGNVFVRWEPDPLSRPGEFQPLLEVAPLLESMLRLVEVQDVQPVGAGGMAISSFGADVPEPGGARDDAQLAGFAPITFYPDGSSDSAEIILTTRESEDGRRMALRILGATGSIKKEPVLPDVPLETAQKTGGKIAN
ncbi:MAG: GspH/FimT family pseudopilin [Verrucomicrobia subdivision 3 bacterium]|nr:GspH/FimT family pseudopilin [Limisphaerales bacterium]